MFVIGSFFIMAHRKEECSLQFRHEVKHEISNLDMLILRQRLRAVMMRTSMLRKGVMKSAVYILTIWMTKHSERSWTV